MSRIGKQKIKIPAGVTVQAADGFISVKGPKGEIKKELHPAIKVVIDNGVATVSVEREDDKFYRSLWGTFAAHIKNMIKGVTGEFKKQLEINGVGFKASVQGTALKLEVGYTNPVVYNIPAGSKVTVEKNIITVTSIDKELVGQVAAEIKNIRKPEPYKGKGIKYVGEVIRMKAGKAAKTAAA
jgi:large subunit ribosomal protein L6